ncbi:MAG: zinc ribbon domain-containing protein [Alphaproteobacteria bacterium]|nr:zinc ribbon domain-containing protein [Alphaproteobacteria bacterium]
MQLLPPPQERPWLLEQLAELIREAGEDRFLRGPLLEPTIEHFPDPFTADARGVEALALRLLAHVGLGELGVDVRTFSSEGTIDTIGPDGSPTSWRHDGAAAWFAGTHDGVCHFGAEEGQLGDPESLVGVMCHEVTHAWRRHHDLEHGDPDLEELLTDLTTVYLGFGVHTVNNTWRVRTRVIELGSSVERSHSGYLSPQAMSFLFAAWLVARDTGPRERKRVLRFLETNQRAMVKAAVDELSRPGRLDDLLERDDPEPMGQIVRLPVRPDTVHRREGNKALVNTVKGVVFGAIVAFFLVRVMPLAAILAVVAGGVIGARLGAQTRVLYCSGCGEELDQNDAVCPRCGGLVR